MSGDLETSLKQLVRRGFELVKEDAESRRLLEDLLNSGIRLLSEIVRDLAPPGAERPPLSGELASPLSPAETSTPPDSQQNNHHPASPLAVPPKAEPVPAAVSVNEAVSSLTLGSKMHSSEAGKKVYDTSVQHAVQPPPKTANPDLELIHARSRLKAAFCLWVVDRERKRLNGADIMASIEPVNRDYIGKAKQLKDCYLWMHYHEWTGLTAEKLAHHITLSNCYNSVAEGIELIQGIDRKAGGREEHYRFFLQAVFMLAEAQSALLVAIHRLREFIDDDQIQTYQWLINTAEQEGFYIDRHLKRDDPADPDQALELQQRMRQCREEMEEDHKRAHQRKKLFGKIRHKCSVIQQNPGDAEHAWLVLADTVHELIEDGLPPSNTELRELLLSVMEYYPGLNEPPIGFDRVLEEVESYLENQADADADDAENFVPRYTEDVKKVSRLLDGRAMVYIGGEKKPEAGKALEKAFGLSDLIWLDTRPHQSITLFESSIARPEVAAVLIGIRFTSHCHSEAKRYCEMYGKPMVRLPRGYNPNQVADQILKQCSDQL